MKMKTENTEAILLTSGMVTLPVPNGMESISIAEIVWAEGIDNYTQFHLINERKIGVARTLKYFEKAFFNSGFFRIHKSYLINMNHARKYIHNGIHSVVMSDHSKIPLARRKQHTFLSRFQHKLTVP